MAINEQKEDQLQCQIDAVYNVYFRAPIHIDDNPPICCFNFTTKHEVSLENGVITFAETKMQFIEVAVFCGALRVPDRGEYLGHRLQLDTEAMITLLCGMENRPVFQHRSEPHQQPLQCRSRRVRPSRASPSLQAMPPHPASRRS